MDEKIVSLLNINLRVIIPDFGAFIIRQQEPRIVVFNEMLKNNDGLLLDYITRKENVDPEIAVQLLSDYTNQAFKILDTGKVLTIEGLGELQKDQYGKVIFRQFSSTGSTEPSVETSDKPSEPGSLASPQPETSPVNEVGFEMVQPRASNPKQVEDPTKFVPGVPLIPRQLLMWILMIVAVNLVVVMVFVLKDHKTSRKIQSRQSPVLSQPVVDQLADSMRAAIADTTPAFNKPAEVSGKTADEELRYYIVAGCFRDEINADELVDSLKSIGYRAEKFGKIGDLYAVSFASFDKKELAVKELERIRKEHHPDAWMTRF